MCLHPRPVDPVPEETARVARAAFPRGNTYMKMRDVLGTFFEDEAFADLFPTRGRPALSPWRLALVTIMQFAENLSDRQAADAVRGRLDWKYCLSLELTDPGFDASVLCEFRSRLAENDKAELLLDVLLRRFRELGILKARGRQRTDATHVLANVRDLNRLELAGETMRLALNSLAMSAPEWLRVHSQPEWIERYVLPFDDRHLPRGKVKRLEEAEKIGRDGYTLLEAAFDQETQDRVRRLPEIETLRKVWLQSYLLTPEGGIRLRNKDEDGLPPAAERIDSPTDADCRSTRRFSTGWLGYKVHLTETCETGWPSLITHVETTPAPASDSRIVPRLHRSLEDANLLPCTHLVDTGYMDARHLVEARERYGLELLGPVRSNVQWPAQERTGFDLYSFEVDWEAEEVTCPEGNKSINWSPRVKDGKRQTKVRFSSMDCRACPSKGLCIRSKAENKNRNSVRELTLISREHYEALRLAREREKTPQYAQEYTYLPRRGGGYRLASSEDLRAEAYALSCPTKGPPGPRHDRRCNEFRSGWGVVLRYAPSSHPNLAVRQTDGGASCSVKGPLSTAGICAWPWRAVSIPVGEGQGATHHDMI